MVDQCNNSILEKVMDDSAEKLDEVLTGSVTAKDQRPRACRCEQKVGPASLIIACECKSVNREE